VGAGAYGGVGDLAGGPVLDSDVLIDYLRVAGPGRDLIRGAGYRVTAITASELALGRSYRDDPRPVHAVLGAPLLMLTRKADPEVARCWSELRGGGEAKVGDVTGHQGRRTDGHRAALQAGPGSWVVKSCFISLDQSLPGVQHRIRERLPLTPNELRRVSRMSGGKLAAVLSLLCALFCAFAAQSASAVQGTTAFVCSADAAELGFSDAHCDSEVSEKGAFGFTEFEEGQEREIEIVNGKTKSETKESTPAVLKGTVAGVAIEISCATVSGSGKSTNKEISEVMQNEGTGLVLKYSSCTVNKPVKCTVKAPIEMKGSSITVENLGAGKNEMGVEFKPEAGKPFTTITFEGAECALKGVSTEVTGTLVGTGGRGNTEAVGSSGATLLFTNEMSKATLKLAGKEAELSSTNTVSIKEGRPITLKTVASPEEVFECSESPEWAEEDCQWWEGVEKTEATAKAEEECPKKKEGEESNLDPIVFVHGIFGNLKSMKTMRTKFKEAGWPDSWLCNWSYDWALSNTEIATLVEEKVNQVIASTGKQKVDIITHSMGGLSTRYYMKEKKGWEKVRQWASLGSPNRGSTVAKKCSLIWTPCEEMVPGSAFLKKLNADETPGTTEYGTWRAGYKNGKPCDKYINPAKSAELIGSPKNWAKNKIMKCMSHSALHEEKEVFESVEKFVK
jgi:triacylglycerol lipase